MGSSARCAPALRWCEKRALLGRREAPALCRTRAVVQPWDRDGLHRPRRAAVADRRPARVGATWSRALPPLGLLQRRSPRRRRAPARGGRVRGSGGWSDPGAHAAAHLRALLQPCELLLLLRPLAPAGRAAGGGDEHAVG